MYLHGNLLILCRCKGSDCKILLKEGSLRWVITKTCPCNIQRFLSEEKMEIKKKKKKKIIGKI